MTNVEREAKRAARVGSLTEDIEDKSAGGGSLTGDIEDDFDAGGGSLLPVGTSNRGAIALRGEGPGMRGHEPFSRFHETRTSVQLCLELPGSLLNDSENLRAGHLEFNRDSSGLEPGHRDSCSASHLVFISSILRPPSVKCGDPSSSMASRSDGA